jgi:hypothetical protein
MVVRACSMMTRTAGGSSRAGGNGLRNEALGTLGVAFITDAGSSDAFSKLARYESNIERALFRALQELQHLQSVRLGNSQDADVAPPAALSGSTE